MRKYYAITIAIMICLISTVGASNGTIQSESEKAILNLPTSPLKIKLSPNQRYLIVENHSDKTVKQYRLGCVTQVENRIKINQIFETISTDLRPPEFPQDEVYCDIFLVSRSGYEECSQKSGLLTVVEVAFDDDCVWKINASDAKCQQKAVSQPTKPNNSFNRSAIELASHRQLGRSSVVCAPG